MKSKFATPLDLNTFCSMALKSLVQVHDGRGGPCPNNSDCFDFKNTAISERWKSSQAEEFRQMHLSGRIPLSCKRCFIEEASGLKSVRQWANSDWYKNFPESLVGHEDQVYFDGPENMVFRLSNICNFACRSCQSEETIKYIAEGLYYKEKYNVSEPTYKEHPRSEFSAEQMRSMADFSSQLKQVQFFGGETMLNKTHEHFLRALIERGLSKNITLYYSTNTSFYPQPERIALWNEFKAVQINFSVDGIDEAFHYLRWPGQWDQCKQNILRYRDELPKKMNCPVSYSANITVTSLNVLHVPLVDRWLKDAFKLGFAMTLAHHPYYYCVQNLHDSAKAEISKRLSLPEYGGTYDFIVQFMNAKSHNPNHWKNFVQYTLRKDAYRKLNFQETFPDLYELLAEEFEKVARDTFVYRETSIELT